VRARLVCVASVWVALAAALTGCPPSGGAPSPTPTASAPAGERFTLRIEAAGDDPAAVIAVVSSLRGCSEKVARALVERAGQPVSLPILTGVPQARAEEGLAALSEAGAKASLARVPD